MCTRLSLVRTRKLLRRTQCKVFQCVRQRGLVVDCSLQPYTVEVLVNKVTLLWWSECNHLNIAKVSVQIQLIRGMQTDILAPNSHSLIIKAYCVTCPVRLCLILYNAVAKMLQIVETIMEMDVAWKEGRIVQTCTSIV